MRLLGGGSAYEAYLAFDEVTYGPVVVKVVRPDQVADEQTLRGLRARGGDARHASTTRSSSAACATSSTASGRTPCSSTSRAPGSRA